MTSQTPRKSSYINAGKPHTPNLSDRILAILKRGKALSAPQIGERLGRRTSIVSDILRDMAGKGLAKRSPDGLWEAA